MKKLVWVILFFASLCSDMRAQAPYLILVSFDGFRYDYVDKTSTPNLNFIQKSGFKSGYLKPSFPSQTFPNHITLATGLHPEHHGIVSNTFYAPDLNKNFSLSDRSAVTNPDFYLGEPIWKTVQRFGKKSASYFWAGSEAIYSDYYFTYYQNAPYDDRISGLNEWINLPYSKRPSVIVLYFEDVDSKGHNFGPNNKETMSAVREADRTVGRIMETIEKSGLKDSTNLIIVSDHGMTELNVCKEINLEPVFEKLPKSASVNRYYSTSSVYLPENIIDSVFSTLPKIDHVTIVKRKNADPKYHIEDAFRYGDILFIPDLGYSFRNEGFWTKADKWKDELFGTYQSGHGYDPEYSDMWGIFYAIGPSIKPNSSVDFANSVDVYPFCLDLLGLPLDHKIDGNADKLEKSVLLKVK